MKRVTTGAGAAVPQTTDAVPVAEYGSAGRTDRFVAIAFCCALLAFAALCIPFRTNSYGVIPNFLQMYGIVLGASEVLTALLLFWRARSSRDARLATLAATYAFSAPLIIANVVTLPGVTAPPGTFPFQAAPWIWVIWHVGWGAGVVLFAMSRGGAVRRPELRWALGLALGTAGVIAALRLPGMPHILNLDGTFPPSLYALYLVALGVYVLALRALLTRWRKLTTLELWVGVAVLALALDDVFTMFSTVRFSLGFYVARGLAMVSGTVVLFAFANDLARLIRRADVLDQYALLDRRLRTFLETVPQIVWTAEANGWIDWYNPRWFEYTGQTPQEAAGWGWQAAHHPEDFPAVMERWPESIASGRPFEMEFRLRRHDGEFQWFLTRVVPHLDQQGRVQRWYGSNTNIDDQKREAQRSARIAQMMQEAFLPDRLPQRDDLRFDALYLPAESDALVGGDWYDAITLPDGRILISCGDVAGHGLNAAVLAGRFRQSIAVTGMEDPEPARVLARVNRIAMLQGENITTAVVAVLDAATLTLDYALAGHPAPIIATRSEKSCSLPSGGLPLGVSEEATWETRTATLERDSVVIFYTDGVTEFAQDIVTAERQLCSAADMLVGDVQTARPAAAVKQIVMDGAPPRDDVAILVLQCSAAAATMSFDEGALTKKWRFHSSDALTAHNSRRTLAEFLASFAADPDELYEAELVIGEAIANTVEHAPGLVEVVIDWRSERPVLTVRDMGPGFSARKAALPADPMSEDGRGMFLINALASEVSIRRSPGFGTELQCVMALSRRADVQATLQQ